MQRPVLKTFKKKLKKVDTRAALWQIGGTHGNKTHYKKMRTKTLLVAVAALAATIITSEAQVYSANVVGYASVVITGGQYNMLANPFNSGVTNGANEVFNGNYTANSGYLPDGT